MIDFGKIVDVVLLMIDASFGFEMEIFEFLNVLQSHGFPKIVGVVTHLDKFKSVEKAALAKRNIKKRFWKDVFPGAKLFSLSSPVYERYPSTQMTNMSRFNFLTSF